MEGSWHHEGAAALTHARMPCRARIWQTRVASPPDRHLHDSERQPSSGGLLHLHNLPLCTMWAKPWRLISRGLGMPGAWWVMCRHRL